MREKTLREDSHVNALTIAPLPRELLFPLLLPLWPEAGRGNPGKTVMTTAVPSANVYLDDWMIRSSLGRWVLTEHQQLGSQKVRDEQDHLTRVKANPSRGTESAI
jgi:hypothetical protein